MSDFSKIDLLISTVLAFIMLGIGMSLTWKDMKAVFHFPKAFMVGLTLQMIIVPLLSFTAAYYWDLSAEWKVGFVILAICPGGTSASFISYLFKANVALSIALTNINSLLTLFTIPLLTNFALRLFLHQDTLVQLPFWETVLQIFLITLVPAILGILIRQIWEDFAIKAQQILKYLTIVMLGVVFTIKIFGGGNAALSFADTLNLLPITLLLNVLGMSLGYLAAKIFQFSTADGFTIGVEMAIHNTSLAFLVGSTLLHNDFLIQPALVYSLFSFWTAILFGLLVMRKR